MAIPFIHIHMGMGPKSHLLFCPDLRDTVQIDFDAMKNVLVFKRPSIPRIQIKWSATQTTTTTTATNWLAMFEIKTKSSVSIIEASQDIWHNCCARRRYYFIIVAQVQMVHPCRLSKQKGPTAILCSVLQGPSCCCLHKHKPKTK